MGRYSFLQEDHDDDDCDSNNGEDSVNDPMAVDGTDADGDGDDQQQQQHEEDYEYDRWRQERERRRSQPQTEDKNNWQIVEHQNQNQHQHQQHPYDNGHGHDPFPRGDTGVVSDEGEQEEGEIREYNDRSNISRRRRRRGWGDGVGGGDIHYHIHIDGREVLRTSSSSTNGNDSNLNDLLVAGRVDRNMLNSRIDEDEPNDINNSDRHHHRPPHSHSHSWQSICHTLLAVVAVTAHICYWYGDRHEHTPIDQHDENVGESSSSSKFRLPSSWSNQNLWPSSTSFSIWSLFEQSASNFHQRRTSYSEEPYWVFPSQWNLLEDHHSDDDRQDQTISSRITIHGQDLALQIVQDRLNNQEQTGIVSQTNTILYLTGGGDGTPSIGKTSLVYKLLEQMTLSLPHPSLFGWQPFWSSSSRDHSSLKHKNAYGKCQDEWNQMASTSSQGDDEENDGPPSCPLIRIDPSDLMASDFADDSRLVGSQLSSNGNDLIVLLERVDEWTNLDLMTTLNKIRDVNQDQQPTSSGRRLVVVMTSNVGSNTQEKWIRKYLQQHAQQQQLSSSTRDADGNEIDGTTNPESLSSSLPTNTMISRPVINKELIPLLKQDIQEFHGLSMIDDLTIIPFNVLDRNAIRSILLDYINHSSSLLPFTFQVTTSGLDRLLDDHLEWHQWIHKSSGQTIRKWSPSGASQVTELWNSHMAVSLQQQQQRQISSDNGCIVQDESTVDGAGNGSNRLTTILDVDEGSTDRFALRSCYQMVPRDGDSPNSGDKDTSITVTTKTSLSDSNTCHGRTVRVVVATKDRSNSITRDDDSKYSENKEEEEMYCCPVDRLPCRFYI